MTQTSTDQMQKLKSKAAVGAETEMKASIRESLSALVDSEASEIEVHRLLKLAESDPEIKASWRRYQLMRSILKRDLEVDPRLDLSGRISAAIADEEPLAGSGGRLRQWRDGLGKLAIAASVTAVFIVGAQQVGRHNPQEAVQTVESAGPSLGEPVEVAVGAPSGFELPSFTARTVSTDTNGTGADVQGYRISPVRDQHPQAMTQQTQWQNSQALQHHFNSLLIKHAERSSSNGSMGLIPFARVSNMEAAQE